MCLKQARLRRRRSSCNSPALAQRLQALAAGYRARTSFVGPSTWPQPSAPRSVAESLLPGEGEALQFRVVPAPDAQAVPGLTLTLLSCSSGSDALCLALPILTSVPCPARQARG